jgi:hypothetical protein
MMIYFLVLRILATAINELLFFQRKIFNHCLDGIFMDDEGEHLNLGF